MSNKLNSWQLEIRNMQRLKLGRKHLTARIKVHFHGQAGKLLTRKIINNNCWQIYWNSMGSRLHPRKEIIFRWTRYTSVSGLVLTFYFINDSVYECKQTMNTDLWHNMYCLQPWEFISSESAKYISVKMSIVSID